MGLFSRIKQICRAKANKAVTKEENKDPAALMQLAINDAQEQINTFRKAVQTQGAEKKRQEDLLEKYKAEAKKWGRNAETALAEGNEDLARQALERQTSAEQNAEATKASLKTVTARYNSAKDNLLKNQKLVRDKDLAFEFQGDAILITLPKQPVLRDVPQRPAGLRPAAPPAKLVPDALRRPQQ